MSAPVPITAMVEPACGSCDRACNALVCGGVYAEGKPGNNGQAGGAERCRELLGVADALCAGVAAADDGE